MSADALRDAEERLRHALESPAGLASPEAGAGVTAALQHLHRVAGDAIDSSGDASDLDACEHLVLRQKGALNQLLRSLGTLPPEFRKQLGAAANAARVDLTARLAASRERLGSSRTRGPAFDVTEPGRTLPVGRPHVLNQVRDQLLDIFRGMGFGVAEDREVEDDQHNFGALNFGPHHPARDAHDTLFLKNGLLLRTHTSPVQIRVMEATRPPIRMVFPGRVYRAEQLDASHAAEFHQLEGLYVDRGVTMAHLKGTLAAFARAFLGEGTRTRFRPSYFPFVEPGGEMDVSCMLCAGTGRREGTQGEVRCGVCKGTGWMEILGCGMVHPNVFRSVGIDPEEWTGFAFGMGFDRITMLKHGIPDVRYILENDLRFLEQF